MNFPISHDPFPWVSFKRRDGSYDGVDSSRRTKDCLAFVCGRVGIKIADAVICFVDCKGGLTVVKNHDR